DHAADLVEVGEAGSVEALRARVAVGDEPLDRRVQVVDAADVVLAPPGQQDARLAGGLRGLRDPRGGDLDRVHAAGGRVVVLDRAPGGSGAGEQPHRLGDAAGVVRVEA